MTFEAENVAILHGIDLAGSVPREFRLFGAGVTATKKGDFVFDDAAASAVMDAFRAQGIDRLPIDVAHGMVNGNTNPEAHKAVGWFVPVVRPDIENGGGLALFATDVEWTERGLSALQAREFRFFSPAINFDADSRRITGLVNVALTNIPATKHQRPLVLDALEATNHTTNEEISMKILLDTLSASDESGAVAKVVELQAFKSAVLLACNVAEDKVSEHIAQLSQAAVEIEALKAEKVAAIRSAKLDALSKDGKLPPAQRAFAASLSDEQLDQFAATLSSVTAHTIEEKPGHELVETLSDAERIIAEAFGLSEDDMRESK